MTPDASGGPARRSRLLDPMYALVGATGLTAERLRILGAAAESRADRDPATPALARLRDDAVVLVRGTRRVPAAAVGDLLHRYSDMAQRGQRVVSGVVPRVREAAQTTQDRREAQQASRARREAQRRARRMDKAAGEQVVEAASQLTGRARGQVDTPAEGRVREDRRDRGRHPTLRSAAVSDPAVTALNPIGGRYSSRTPGRVASGGVEAGAALSFRRSPRVRAAQGDADAPAAGPSQGSEPNAGAPVLPPAGD